MIVLICDMPRAKEFDEAEVLDHALELFRARGFAHTSFEDLTEGLGVSRQSLYDTYGDKHTLYLTALKSYLERSVDFMRRSLDGSGPVREAMAGMFEGAISSSCGKGSPGCLMVNSMVELAPHDGDIRALAQAHARDHGAPRLHARQGAAQGRDRQGEGSGRAGWLLLQHAARHSRRRPRLGRPRLAAPKRPTGPEGPGLISC